MPTLLLALSLALMLVVWCSTTCHQIPSMGFSTDHQAIVWCNQLVRKITTGTINMVHRCYNTAGRGHSRGTSSRGCNTTSRTAIYRRALLGKSNQPLPSHLQFAHDAVTLAHMTVSSQLLRFAPVLLSVTAAVTCLVLARLLAPQNLPGAVGAWFAPPSPSTVTLVVVVVVVLVVVCCGTIVNTLRRAQAVVRCGILVVFVLTRARCALCGGGCGGGGVNWLPC